MSFLKNAVGPDFFSLYRYPVMFRACSLDFREKICTIHPPTAIWDLLFAFHIRLALLVFYFTAGAIYSSTRTKLSHSSDTATTVNHIYIQIQNQFPKENIAAYCFVCWFLLVFCKTRYWFRPGKAKTGLKLRCKFYKPIKILSECKI